MSFNGTVTDRSELDISWDGNALTVRAAYNSIRSLELGLLVDAEHAGTQDAGGGGRGGTLANVMSVVRRPSQLRRVPGARSNRRR
jgi:hypothetical protein